MLLLRYGKIHFISLNFTNELQTPDSSLEIAFVNITLMENRQLCDTIFYMNKKKLAVTKSQLKCSTLNDWAFNNFQLPLDPFDWLFWIFINVAYTKPYWIQIFEQKWFIWKMGNSTRLRFIQWLRNVSWSTLFGSIVSKPTHIETISHFCSCSRS